MRFKNLVLISVRAHRSTMTTKLQTAWFAGFYEGEGTVCNDKSNGYCLRLSISQNDVEPLKIGQKLWGGKIYKRVRKSPASDKICTCYEWRLCHRLALIFLKDIKPYMIIPRKIAQMENAIKGIDTPLEAIYKCRFCDKAYTYSSNRRRHEKKEHIDRGKLHECDLCFRKYKSRDSLRRHKRINHKSINASGAEKILEQFSSLSLQDTSLLEIPKASSVAASEKLELHSQDG